MKKLITFALLTFCAATFAQRATFEAPIVNGDFSSTTQRNNGTLNGRAPFMQGATGWQIPNSYNVGVQGGALTMYETFSAASRYRPTVDKAQQWFTAPVDNYFVSFDYQIVGADPYVAGTNLYVKVGTTDYQVPWVETSGWVTSKFRTYLAQQDNMIEIGTNKAPKVMNTNILPDPTAYAKVDNIRVWKYAPTPAIPEPETYVMMLAGLAVIAIKTRKTK